MGLLRKGTKSSSGVRTLRLPAFAVAMLRRRKLASGGRAPAFPDSAGGWRDPSNTSCHLRNARGSEEFAWVTSHVFRKTARPSWTGLDRAGISARQITDQLGHSKVSMRQDQYLGRRALDQATADALNQAHTDAASGKEKRVPGTGSSGHEPLTCGFAPPVGLEPTTLRLTVACSAD